MAGLRERLARPARTLRRIGARRAAREAVSAIGSWLWEHTAVVVFEARAGDVRATPDPVGATITSGVLCGSGTPAEAVAGLPLPARRLALGDPPPERIYRALQGDELAGWGFRSGPVPHWLVAETTTKVALGEDAVCLYGFWVIDRYRGCGLYQALLRRMLDDAFREGVARVRIWCVDSNAASRAAIERVGFRPIAIHRRARTLGRVSTREVSVRA